MKNIAILFLFVPSISLATQNFWHMINANNGMTATCKIPRTTCLKHLEAGCKKSGIYNIKNDDTTTTTTYCDQVKDGGGWTLVMAQTQPPPAYVQMMAKNLTSINLSSNGGFSRIEEIYAKSTESRWTDTSLNRFIQFSLYNNQNDTTAAPLTIFSNQVKNVACSASSLAWIKFSNGYLNTGTLARRIEMCRAATNGSIPLMFFGFRNNTNYAGIRDIVNNTTTHECWKDENSLDRMFALHADPISYGYCNQFGYNWTGTGVGRGGSMNYYMWAR